jgi:hypothetical protein
MIRKPLFYLIMFIAVSFLAVSCEPVEKSFDESLLPGKWQSGTLFYKYLSSGSGSTWDTSDDVTEAEGQAFTWTLVKSDFTHIHLYDNGDAGIPKVYTVSELTATTLKYHDDFGVNSSFTKISK